MPNPKGINQYSGGGKKAVGGGSLNSKGFRKKPISKKQLLKNDSMFKRGTNPGSTR